MTSNAVCAIVVLLPTLGLAAPVQQVQTTAPHPPGHLCEEVVTTHYPQWTSKISRDRLARVEVRNCRVEDWGFLQIAAWNADAARPSLVVDTRRTTIVKTAMVGNVFVLETGGASSNVIQVVVYKDGRPQLVFDDAIKAYAHIDITWRKVVVGLPQDKGPEKVYEFSTGMN
jgi:hypothetical protein